MSEFHQNCYYVHVLLILKLKWSYILHQWFENKEVSVQCKFLLVV